MITLNTFVVFISALQESDEAMGEECDTESVYSTIIAYTSDDKL